VLKRAFFSLYLLVVLAIFAAGWGLDRFYQSMVPSTHSDAADQALFALLQTRLDTNLPETSLAAALQQESQAIGLRADLYRLDDFARSTLREQIASGERVAVSGSEQYRELYQRLGDSAYVLRLQIPRQPVEGQSVRDLLLLVFYLLLAGVIFLWIWPLIRDLRSLQQQTHSFGRGTPSERISLHSRSAVYQLGVEFNRMQARIDELLDSYREMTYAVSHELRTPLTRMKFALELGEQITQSPQMQKHLASLRADVAEMDTLINQLLSYAGFEAQTQVLIQQPGDLAALVRQWQTNQGVFSAHIQWQLMDELNGDFIYCEWPLMECVLHNLLSNASRYARECVRVTLRREGEDAVVLVEDDGRGILPADRERVFESFVRLRKTTEVKGFGLGLAIVRRIMGWHLGSCRVLDSELGGACLELRWPQPAVSGRLSDSP